MNRTLFIALFIVLCAGGVQADPSSSTTHLVRTPLPNSSAAQPSVQLGRDLYYHNEGPIIGPRAPHPKESDYPQLLGESRLVIWIVAQQHRYWVAFVQGAVSLVTMLEIWGLLFGSRQRASAWDALAREWLTLVMFAISVAAVLGALLRIGLVALYPDLMAYLLAVFRPTFLIFGALLLPFTVLSWLYLVTVECRIGKMAPCDGWYRSQCGWCGPRTFGKRVEQFHDVPRRH